MPALYVSEMSQVLLIYNSSVSLLHERHSSLYDGLTQFL